MCLRIFLLHLHSQFRGMAEWTMALAWKASKRATVSGVRIPFPLLVQFHTIIERRSKSRLFCVSAYQNEHFDTPMTETNTDTTRPEKPCKDVKFLPFRTLVEKVVEIFSTFEKKLKIK